MKCQYCNQELPKEILEEEKPIIIGKTTRRHGFNGFKYIEPGSSIYSFQNSLYLEQESERNGSIHKVKYNKEMLDKL